jgi:hypothetical protein
VTIVTSVIVLFDEDGNERPYVPENDKHAA